MIYTFFFSVCGGGPTTSQFRQSLCIVLCCFIFNRSRATQIKFDTHTHFLWHHDSFPFSHWENKVIFRLLSSCWLWALLLFVYSFFSLLVEIRLIFHQRAANWRRPKSQSTDNSSHSQWHYLTNFHHVAILTTSLDYNRERASRELFIARRR